MNLEATSTGISCIVHDIWVMGLRMMKQMLPPQLHLPTRVGFAHDGLRANLLTRCTPAVETVQCPFLLRLPNSLAAASRRYLFLLGPSIACFLTSAIINFILYHHPSICSLSNVPLHVLRSRPASIKHPNNDDHKYNPTAPHP